MKSQYIFLISIMLLTIFAIGVASASDVQSNDFNISSGDVDCLTENAEAVVVSENEDISEGQTADDSFKALENEINNATDILILKHDYTYDLGSDNASVSIIKDNFTIDGQGYTIDAKNQTGIFNITGNNVTLKNIKFINGNATGNGGAVLAGNLTVMNSIFDSNFAKKGGAICAENLWIYDSTFMENTAEIEGGAIYAPSYLTISNSLFSLNSAYNGGAVSAANVNITHSKFESNKAESRGGALYSANAYIFNSTFLSNSASNGGAIRSDYANVVNSSFEDNNAEYGGAVSAAAMNIAHSEFHLNCAEFRGGALYSANAYIFDSTFWSNSAKYGGAIRSDYANVVKSTFRINFAVIGGGISVLYNLNVTDSIFKDNYVDIDGGGFCAGDVNVINSTFIKNIADKGGAGFKAENAEVINSTFRQNAADSCGGGFVSTNANVVNSTFIQNTAGENGGGIYSYDVLNVSSSYFEQNGAVSAAALASLDMMNLTSSQIINNSASIAGAVLCPSGVIDYCIFENNSAQFGGAIIADEEVKISNTIFRGNFASGGGNDILIGENPAVLSNVTPDNILQVRAVRLYAQTNAVSYPQIVRIETFLINSYDSLISTGNVSCIINNRTYHADVVNGTAIIEIPDLDVGSYDCEVVFDGGEGYIRPTYNVSFEVYASFKTLQDEINNASDILLLNHDYFYDSSIDNGTIVISRSNFTIDGQGCTIDAKNQAGIFNITGNNVTLKNIKFINGNATGNGGAILAGNLTVISSIFDSNFANEGGAIYAENLWIYDSTFRENTAVEGGALYSYCLTISNSRFYLNSAEDGGVLSADWANIADSEFYSNNAGYSGGALFTEYANIVNSTFVLNSAAYGGAMLSDNINIVNSSFRKNSATFGGGIYTLYGFNVSDSIFEENAAEIYGGGIYSGHNLNVTDSIFKENTAMDGGGFYVHDAFVLNSTFIKNTAKGGGAGFNAHDADVFNSTFTQNTAGTCGGGFMSTNANVFNSTFIQNTATEEHGGGIYAVDVLNVSNSYFEQNRAFYAGACAGMEMMIVISSQFINNTALFIAGAVFCEPAIIDDCIFENNSAQYGGAIIAGRKTNISNTIFRGNVAPGGGNEIVIGEEHVILNNVTPDNILQVQWVQLYAEANNVYYPQTVMIETGILLGPDVVNVTGNVSCIINNMTYYANVVNGLAVIEIPDLDVGSYDCEVVFNGGEEYVKSSWKVNFEVYASFKALQDDVNNASGILLLNHDYTYESAVDDGAVVISKDNLVIDGQNHTIDAKGQASIFEITADNVTLKNIRLINGNAAEDGGAIKAIGNLTVIGCEFANNTASFFGGAIDAENLTVEDSLFINNSAYLSGAISADELVIEDSVFIHNEAYVAGAVYAVNHMVVYNTLFEYNRAQWSGALESPNCEVFNSTFVSNYAQEYAGIFAFNLTLKGSKFINNSVSGPECAVHISSNGLIEGVLFENNSAVYASAVFAQGQVVIKDTIFRNNADSNGAAIIVTKENYLTLVNVTPSNIVSMVKNYIDEIDVSDVVYGDTVRMTVTLGWPANGCNVSCTINNRTYSAEVVNGSATIELSGLDAKSYSCDVVFGDDVKYIKSIKGTSFEVSKRNATISAADKEYVINYAGKYSVTVGNLVSNVKVTFVLNGKTVATATTQSNGVATFTLTEKMLKNAKAGKKSLVIKIGDANYNIANKTVKITINKEKTKITAKAKTFKRTVKTKKYTMALKNSKGKAMKNVKVYLKVKGKKYTAKTNSKGKATFKITKLTKKGTFKATITYKGNAYYAKATKKVNIKCK